METTKNTLKKKITSSLKTNLLNLNNTIHGLKGKSTLLRFYPDLKSPTALKRKKGDMGIIGVIGGSIEYTGAPFYSALSVIKAGSDLSHVFCHKDAAVPIKSYSPELIVHPAFDDAMSKDLIEKSVRWFKSMDALVYGCGLGREHPTQDVFEAFFKHSSNLKGMIHVLDADALWHLMNMKEIEKIDFSNSQFVLTPNKVEFNRLFNNIFIKDKENKNFELFDILFDYDQEQFSFFDFLNNEKKNSTEDQKLIENEILYFSLENKPNNNNEKIINDSNNAEFIEFLKNLFIRETLLAKKLNCIVLKKGFFDIITDGTEIFLIKNEGSRKRCGGIGDILTGILAANLAIYKKNNSETEKLNLFANKIKNELLVVCSVACFICRETAKLAFFNKGVSLTAPDVIEEIHNMLKIVNPFNPLN